MRKYAQIRPTFWTRGSGKLLRGNRDAQVLALYLMTAPSSSRTGLYYAPMVGILHDTGLSEEAFMGALSAIAEIAQYDFSEELVWLPNGCREQMGLGDGERIRPNDKALKSVLTELEAFGSHPFVVEFRTRYLPGYEAPSKGDVVVPGRGIRDHGMPPVPAPAPAPAPPDPEGECEGKPEPDGRSNSLILCPGPDLALSQSQIATLETNMMIPRWAIDVMLTEWCLDRQARGDRQTLRAWRTFAGKDIRERWNNPALRPKRPETPEALATRKAALEERERQWMAREQAKGDAELLAWAEAHKKPGAELEPPSKAALQRRLSGIGGKDD